MSVSQSNNFQELAEMHEQQLQQQQVVENSHYSTLNDEMEVHQKQNIELISPIRINKLYPDFTSENTIPSEFVVSLDSVIKDVGFGWYQILSYFVICCFGMTEGSQITIFTLTIPILENQWKVSSELTSLQASFVFVGFLIGAMISGQFTDRYGRRLSFLVSSFLTTAICLGSALAQDIYQLLVLRGLLGIVVGLFAPCSVTMLQEITPTHLRGRFMSLVTLSTAIGQLYGLFVGSLVLKSLTEGNWRLLTFWCSLPAAIAWVVSLFIVTESPRFALFKGQYELFFAIMKKMIRMNRSNYDFSEEVQYKLINWVHTINRQVRNSQSASISSLFTHQRLLMTCILWFTWFSLCFMYYGNTLLLPYTLQNMNHQYINTDPMFQLVISCLSDMLGAILGSTFIEIKGFGRKNSLIIFIFLSGISSGFVYFDINRFLLWTTLQKFFLSMGFIFNYQLSVEVYPTKLRATGLGLAIAIGRFGGIVMPWTCMALAKYDLLSPFLLFALLAFITSLSDVFIPFDTMGRELDT